jgi:hypothetical protein
VQPLTQEPIPPSGSEPVGPADPLLLVAEVRGAADVWLVLVAEVF